MKKSSFGGEERARDRTLSKTEIGELFSRLPGSGLAPPIQAALRLILATGVRAGEMINAKWDDIDKKQREWRLPETKTGVSHLVHLSDFALEQLATLEAVRTGTYLIQGRRENSPYVRTALAKLIQERVTVGRALKGRSVTHAGKLALSGGDWTLHDLRRTMASRMQDIKIMPHVIERCLNHTPPSKIVRTYQTSDYMRERREAYIAWGRQLALIEAGKTNVIALKR